MSDLSVAMFKMSLEANGLPTYGMKEEMLQRLLASGGKTKPGSQQNVEKTATSEDKCIRNCVTKNE